MNVSALGPIDKASFFFLEACTTGVSGLAIMSDCECDITRNSVARPRPHMGLSPVLENEGPSEARRVLFTVGDLMMLKETEYAWARLSAVLHKDDSLHVVHVETAESVEVSSHRGGVVFPVFNDRKEPRRKWLPSFCDLTPFKDHRVLLLKSRPGVTVEQAILRYLPYQPIREGSSSRLSRRPFPFANAAPHSLSLSLSSGTSKSFRSTLWSWPPGTCPRRPGSSAEARQARWCACHRALSW